MNCPYCGTPVSGEKRFCPNCGGDLSDQQNTNAQPTTVYYQQTYTTVNNEFDPNRDVSTAAWVGIGFLSLLPLVNLILLIVWAFGGTNKPSLRNYARGMLIVMLIIIGVLILLSLTIGLSLGAFFSQIRYY